MRFARLDHRSEQEARMLDSKILDDVSARVAAAFAASPVRDAEKNLKSMLSGALAKLDLVTREEFDIQARVLLRTREKLEALEARVADLEAAPGQNAPADADPLMALRCHPPHAFSCAGDATAAAS